MEKKKESLQICISANVGWKDAAVGESVLSGLAEKLHCHVRVAVRELTIIRSKSFKNAR